MIVCELCGCTKEEAETEKEQKCLGNTTGFHKFFSTQTRRSGTKFK